jgi:hypothetical protein
VNLIFTLSEARVLLSLMVQINLHRSFHFALTLEMYVPTKFGATRLPMSSVDISVIFRAVSVKVWRTMASIQVGGQD